MTAPKRRWPRFTLRTLFVVVTGLAFWIAWGASIIRSEMPNWELIPFVAVSAFIVTVLASAFLTWFVTRRRS